MITNNEKYIAAIDQGTTSSRCILFDHSGRICSEAQKEFTQIFPEPGWVEHDPKEIWGTVQFTFFEAMSKIGARLCDIEAIGITNQRETTVVWDKETGEPVYNAIVWQCRRTSAIVDDLVEKGHGKRVKAITGLQPDAYFSGTKIRWILDNVEGARERAISGKLLFGTIDTWLIWQLTGGKVHATDYTNASRTMLYDIHRLCWSEELLDILDIPASMLPEVRPSSGVFGYTDPDIMQVEIPVAGVAGDQQAALFGQCCFSPGMVKNTYGTGCFLLMNTGDRPVESQNGLITTIGASIGNDVQYVLEGSVFVAGAAIQWLRDGLQMFTDSAESEEYARSVPDTAGGYVVPAFTGLGAPYWDQYARGAVVGITRGFTKAHFIRATLESLAYQSYDILRAMERDTEMKINDLRVDGGACANDFLMQFQSDLMKRNVIRPECIETTAMGAAYLAGLAVGYWKDMDEIRRNWAISREFKPSMDEALRLRKLHGWNKAVQCALGWEE